MALKITKIVVIFGVLLWIANMLFNPNSGSSIKGGTLFSKDLVKKVQKGQLVIVDKNESDQYIQEDLSTHNLLQALTFARYKSEVLEQPLYLENAATLGKANKSKNNYVAKVDPSDRQAWQHLILLEIELKTKYAKSHPNDLEGYNTEEAMDINLTPAKMTQFIEKYPDSYVVSTALAHIEYCLCVAQNKSAQAQSIYTKLAKKFPDSEVLNDLLPVYEARAKDFAAKKVVKKAVKAKVTKVKATKAKTKKA